MHPLVSVIIPTRNRPEDTISCVKSVRAQNYPNIEIIVVDGNSTDNTREAVTPFADKVLTFPTPGDHRCAQRNLGVENAHGEYVLIIDSDMVLTPNVIRECVEKYYSKSNIAGVVIPEESFGVGFWAKCKALEKKFYQGVEWMEAARFYKRDLYLQLGGYDVNLTSGEDWDLSQRAAAHGVIERVASVIMHNEGHISLIGTVKKKFYYASKLKKYTEQTNSSSVSKQTNLITRYKLFFSKKPIIVNHPVLWLGMLYMKTCEFGAGAIGIGKTTLFQAPQKKEFIFLVREKVKFYASYIYYKLIIPLETESPKWKLFINELVYCMSKFSEHLANKPLPFQIPKVTNQFGIYNIRKNSLDSIWASPAFERRDVNCLFKLLDKLTVEKKRILFFDIGADFGTYTVAVGNRYKSYNDIHTHSFEPSKESFELLNSNIDENQLKGRVTSYNFGLFDSNEMITLYHNPTDPGSNTINPVNNSDNLQEEIIEVRALDGLDVIFDKNDVVVMKIDVEGVESQVLEGAKKLLLSGVEIHLVVEDFVNTSIIKFLKSKHFIFVNKITTYNSWWYKE